jgi:hypothetical protein
VTRLFEVLPLTQAMPALLPSEGLSGKVGHPSGVDPQLDSMTPGRGSDRGAKLFDPSGVGSTIDSELGKVLAARAVVEQCCGSVPAPLQAAMWLYVDDLNRSHEISQGIAGPVGAYWHGIMHRREGDFWNAKYWLRQAEPIWSEEACFRLDSSSAQMFDGRADGYNGGSKLPHSNLRFDPLVFVDQVEAARGANPVDLVAMQRLEWMALFTYCVERVGE